MKLKNVVLPTNREPWLIPMEERISLLHKAYRENKKICAMLYDHADTSTFRYRCYNLLQWTQESRSWQVVYFYRSEVDTLLSLLDKVSILVFARLQWFHAVDTLLYKAHSLKVPVLYEVDDRIFDLDALPLLTNSIDVDFSVDGQYEYWFSYISRNGFTASKADGFLTTNAYLGEYLKQKFGKPFRVIHNSLNKEQLLVSEQCRKEKETYGLSERQKRRKSPDKFTIGYFSGSPSHNNDLAMISAELALFLDKHDDALLKVVGFMQFPEVLQPAITRGQIIFEPLTDFLNLQVLTAEVDVNIVPLIENTFTNCKSELKFFEAAAVNTLTVASPIYTYAHCIRHGENGFLCSPGHWYDTLEVIYENKDSMSGLIQQALKDSLQAYSGEAFIREIEEALDFFS